MRFAAIPFTGDIDGPAIDIDARAAGGGPLQYVGLPNRTLTYMIEGQPAVGSGPLATSRPRYWQVDGAFLTLTTKDDAGNLASVGRWRKIQ